MCSAPAPQHRHAVAAARHRRGFTLIELIVVLAIVGLLAGIAVPRYVRSLEVAQERALRSTLATVRDAIDAFAADKGRHPATLQELVDERYLRALPEDPLTARRDAWVLLGAPPGADGGGVHDLRSGAAGRGSDGRLYAEW